MLDLECIMQDVYSSTRALRIQGLRELQEKLESKDMQSELVTSTSKMLNGLATVLGDSDDPEILTHAAKALGMVLRQYERDREALRECIRRRRAVEHLIETLTWGDAELASQAADSLCDLARALDMKEELQASSLPEALLTLFSAVPESPALVKVVELVNHVYDIISNPSMPNPVRRFYNTLLQVLWRQTDSGLPLPSLNSMLPFLNSILYGTTDALEILWACKILKKCMLGDDQSDVSRKIVASGLVPYLMTAIKLASEDVAIAALECVNLLGKLQCDAILEVDFEEALSSHLRYPGDVAVAACLAIQGVLEGGKSEAVNAMENLFLMEEVTSLLNLDATDLPLQKAALEALLLFIRHADMTLVLRVLMGVCAFFRTAMRGGLLPHFRDVVCCFPDVKDKVREGIESKNILEKELCSNFTSLVEHRDLA